MEHLRLFWLFVRTSVQNDTEYRADFFAQIMVTLLGLLGVYNFMYGFIGAVIAPNMRQVLEDVRQGTLDFALLKPVNSQFLVSVRQFVIWRLSDIALGIALAVYASLQLAHQVSAREALLFPLTLLCGAVIVYSFW